LRDLFFVYVYVYVYVCMYTMFTPRKEKSMVLKHIKHFESLLERERGVVLFNLYTYIKNNKGLLLFLLLFHSSLDTVTVT
jgi:hypothetical protein